MFSNIIAVYDSLRLGLDNHTLIVDGQLIGIGWLTGYKMSHLGTFPAVIKTHDMSDRVRVEWYKVTDSMLEALDRLQEYDPASPSTSLFTRKCLYSPYGKGEIYLYNQSLENAKPIEGGDWQRVITEPKYQALQAV